mmetsp:Transcript_10322/g.20497  ORF Transcript_10322/g.20497 Transcript_10322/m.20497 type:complete len:247 (+) Transcript_10322:404-1144(+)
MAQKMREEGGDYDLVFMDQDMQDTYCPGNRDGRGVRSEAQLQGHESVQLMRKMEFLFPIVMRTSSCGYEDMSKYACVGADAILPKQTPVKPLKSLLKRTLECMSSVKVDAKVSTQDPHLKERKTEQARRAGLISFTKPVREFSRSVPARQASFHDVTRPSVNTKKRGPKKKTLPKGCQSEKTTLRRLDPGCLRKRKCLTQIGLVRMLRVPETGNQNPTKQKKLSSIMGKAFAGQAVSFSRRLEMLT